MNTKILFYSCFALMFAGSITLTDMSDTQLADVVTVSSSDDSDERGPREKREEGYELMESQAEFDTPHVAP